MDGIINVFKPAGMSSFSCVKKVARSLGVPKAGHGGTLDPEATGILPVFVGKATKLADFMHDYDKSYRAEFLLGIQTDSFDIWGNITASCDANELNDITEERVNKVLKSFIGECEQIPPAYSAVKIGGVPAYKLARKGKDVEIKSRKVNIFSADLISYDSCSHKGIFEISCSKGTYIRTVCSDIGKSLGCGACMTALIRTQYGPFNIDNSVNLEGCTPENLLPCDFLLKDYPSLELDDFEARQYASGAYKMVSADDKPISGILLNEGYIRIYNNNKLFALAKYEQANEEGIIKLIPYKFFG